MRIPIVYSPPNAKSTQYCEVNSTVYYEVQYLPFCLKTFGLSKNALENLIYKFMGLEWTRKGNLVTPFLLLSNN